MQKNMADNNIVAGLAISPKTPVLKIKDYLDEGIVDIVVVCIG